MLYNSTRNKKLAVTSAKAITQGLSTEGGLFVPEQLPQLSYADLEAMQNKTYAQRAEIILSKFLTDFTPDEISHCVNSAYNDKNFASDNISEISHLFDGTYMLELWHGPTCAFKDMALQLLPYLLTTSAKKEIPGKEIAILVATSGDTGKAALEGFKDVDGTKIIVFYPEDGVSPMQKRQMTTQEGKNVSVCAIKGNFDDAQTGVKTIFADNELKEKLEKNKITFSSANSINWGRLVPQIVYYVSSYLELVKYEQISIGEIVNVVVPTGNFGNILAAYYAKNMGVPIGKLICASNANNVLTDFIRTGTYNKNRDFITTISPSMDILISSNLERLLYDLTGKDDEKIQKWFAQLAQNGEYTVDDNVKTYLSQNFYAGCCNDAETKETITSIFNKYSYLCDTHTAVAVKVYNDYVKETGDTNKTIIASTASPYKFTQSVLECINNGNANFDEFEQVEQINKISGLEIPKSLLTLKDKKVLFNTTITKDQMVDKVMEMLNLK